MSGYDRLGTDKNPYMGFDEEEFAIYKSLKTGEVTLGYVDKRRTLLTLNLQKGLFDYLNKRRKKIVDNEVKFIDEYMEEYKELRRMHKNTNLRYGVEYFNGWVELYILTSLFPITFKMFLNYERVKKCNSCENHLNKRLKVINATVKARTLSGKTKDTTNEYGELKLERSNYFILIDPLTNSSKIQYFDCRKSNICFNVINGLKSYELFIKDGSELRRNFKHFIIECSFKIKCISHERKFKKDNHVELWEYFTCNIKKYYVFYRRYLDIKRKQNNDHKH